MISAERWRHTSALYRGKRRGALVGAMTVEDATAERSSWLLAVNQANTPEVGSLDAAGMARLLPMQFAVRIVCVDGIPAGAIFLMRPGQAYRSANYRWFCDRFDDFLYVDRIMIDAQFRGKGLGRLLYADAEALARPCLLYTSDAADE